MAKPDLMKPASQQLGMPARRIDSLFAQSRREFVIRSGLGLGLAGLAGVLAADGLVEPAGAAEPAGRYANPMLPKPPHFTGRAKHVIHLFANGGPSHLDTFDPKPALQKYSGRTLTTE